ncbi:hypothetical protein [Natrinema sp. SYSU A 869]|uniref:hypothetical protein n=1 Tax=Natrinema sp. SYSU A 869 TaxID=2871694 RepID=UPI001CA4249C|nr:hypothetical protein [Natrinema sp. SYSU A 869]
MSAAALKALTLHHALAVGGRTDLSDRFFDRAATVVEIVWEQAIDGDLQYPETDGSDGPASAVLEWYLNRLFRRAHTDRRLSDAVFPVISLQQPPSTWFRPRVFWRVLRTVRNPRTHSYEESHPRTEEHWT